MRAVTISLLVLVATLAHAEDVVLESFETDAVGWSGGERIALPDGEGFGYGVLPGTSVEFTPADSDWSAYRQLKIDVWNPGRVVLAQFLFTDADGRSITAFEYNVYAGRTTQHVRIDGLRNDFTQNAGIDTRRIASVAVQVRNRRAMDPEEQGLILERLRLSTTGTEPMVTAPLADYADLPRTPPGFVHPEFPGFEAGYNTWANDPGYFQILSLPGTGRSGGRALAFIPLEVDRIRIWDGPRIFPEAGDYTVQFAARGTSGSVFRDLQGDREFALLPEWQTFTYPVTIDSAGQSRRFVLEAANLQGDPVYVDDFVVTKDGASGSLAPVSRATGDPRVVTYGDGIIYIDGEPTFVMGFLLGDPDVLKDSPFNYCGPSVLLQEPMAFYDRCAEAGLLTSVNLSASMQSNAPESAAWFAQTYRNHPALFSYYLCDEPDHVKPSAASEPPILARATQILHELDPNHPTHALVIPWCASNMYRFRDVVDFLSADRYAVKGRADNNELWTVWRANEAMRRSATDGQVNLFTPLAGMRSYFKPRWFSDGPGIAREENFAQAYMCVVSGAGGIIWWNLKGALHAWQDYLDVGNELRSIERFLVGVELEAGLRFEGDVLESFTSGKTTYPDFRQIRGIGRASFSEDGGQTAVITVNVTPEPATGVRVHAPFIAHASEATVMFEDRTVPVKDGVIVDDFAGLERHVYVVDGIAEGVRPRPVPQPGGPHVFDSGWRYEGIDTDVNPDAHRLRMERERYMAEQIRKVEEAIARGDKEAARKILEKTLEQYPDAQDIQERLRTL